MNDIESVVFAKVAEKLRAEYDGIFVAGEEINAPPMFPAVGFVEKSNTPCEKMQTAYNRENATELMYEVDVYSNLVNGKKQQAKQIAKTIDEVMSSMGFMRRYGAPVPNIDTTIYRYKLRFFGIYGNDGYIYTG